MKTSNERIATLAKFSKSEDAGIAVMPANAERVYSVGISTGGIAEMRMAELNPNRHIIATTLDKEGAAFAEKLVREQGFTDQIEIKLEDIAKELSYEDGYFDYIYARLVLHYLPKAELRTALQGLHRVLRSDGKLFVVVRSTKCPDATREGAVYDSETGLTTCTVNEGSKHYTYSRYFHTEESISGGLEEAGFAVQSVKSYDEQLYKDFMRTQLSDYTDNVVEVVVTK